MLDNSVLAGEVLRHGAYVCLRPANDADAVVHVASPTAEPVRDFCAEAARMLGPVASVRILGGVVRPRVYTGGAMNNFAYAHAVSQQPGTGSSCARGRLGRAVAWRPGRRSSPVREGSSR